MARIAGVDIPDKKRGEIALTYIFGIGRSNANKILKKAGIDPNIQVEKWNDDQVSKSEVLFLITSKLKENLDQKHK